MEHTLNKALFIKLPNLTCAFRGKNAFPTCTSGVWSTGIKAKHFLQNRRKCSMIDALIILWNCEHAAWTNHVSKHLQLLFYNGINTTELT